MAERGQLTKRKVFMEWQDREEEQWLNQMSLKGWHLVKVKPGVLHCKYYFERGEGKNYIYRLDYPGKVDDRDEYLGLFTDAGWVHVDSLINGWEYFRTETEVEDDSSPEIYTDNSSRVKKYQRVAQFTFLIAAVATINVLHMLVGGVGDTSPVVWGFSMAVTVISVPIALLSFYAGVRVVARIRSIDG